MISAPEYRRIQPYLYRLQGLFCQGCSLVMTRGQVCSHCRTADLNPINLAKQGKVIAITVVHKPPASRRQSGKYTLALIELDDGARILSQITDTESRPVSPGDPVHAVIRRLYEPGREDLICYGFKFRGDRIKENETVPSEKGVQQ